MGVRGFWVHFLKFELRRTQMPYYGYGYGYGMDPLY